MDSVMAEYTCAFCGEVNETLVDPTAGQKQLYVEDCSVCCHPNVLNVSIGYSPSAVVIHAEME
jgi:hypothetical protein